MFLSSLLALHLFVAQMDIVVTETDGTTIQDSTPIEGAVVRVTRGGVEIDATDPTDGSGAAVLTRASEFRDRDVLRAGKADHQPISRRWQDVKNNDPIHFRLPRERPTCQYRVQRVVTYMRRDGTQGCRTVYELKYRDCDMMVYEPPVIPPPLGYKYEFSYAITWWDAGRQMWAHRPYWRLAPACQTTYPIYSAPCCCQ